ncbi:hypothetical protein COU74_04585 [Candidatus Peregrinibacteria bacterium CG10_big_fil_rev_8_21_14_0_10_36_19]|nr:MAG: hypothetical protein COU74_04585 [Candidatus Peregrinibacteria bacterium CG10_big_fil_rev_8_21_14_0_10_36_19]
MAEPEPAENSISMDNAPHEIPLQEAAETQASPTPQPEPIMPTMDVNMENGNPEAQSPLKSHKMIIMAGGAIAGLAIIGGIAYFMLSGSSDTPTQEPPAAPPGLIELENSLNNSALDNNIELNFDTEFNNEMTDAISPPPAPEVNQYPPDGELTPNPDSAEPTTEDKVTR